jgi:hypothetical protein
MLLALIMFLTAAVVIFLPFEPMHFSHLRADEEACVGEPVDIDAKYTIDEEQFNSIRSMEVQSAWIAEDVEGIDPGRERVVSEISMNPDQIRPGVVETKGSAPRTAPTDPGTWRLKLRNTVRGTPSIQEVETESENTTEVLPKDSPECTGEESLEVMISW